MLGRLAPAQDADPLRRRALNALQPLDVVLAQRRGLVAPPAPPEEVAQRHGAILRLRLGRVQRSLGPVRELGRRERARLEIDRVDRGQLFARDPVVAQSAA